VIHGTRGGYIHYGCRCDPCREAQRDYQRGYREDTDLLSRLIAAAPPPVGEWAARGACVGLPVDLFHLERGGVSPFAKETCAGCPVRDECLDYALTNVIRHGVWGGTSEKERRKLRAARKQVAS
jgi:WhiB family redox-sensing transcriptional regulator